MIGPEERPPFPLAQIEEGLGRKLTIEETVSLLRAWPSASRAMETAKRIDQLSWGLGSMRNSQRTFLADNLKSLRRQLSYVEYRAWEEGSPLPAGAESALNTADMFLANLVLIIEEKAAIGRPRNRVSEAANLVATDLGSPLGPIFARCVAEAFRVSLPPNAFARPDFRNPGSNISLGLARKALAMELQRIGPWPR